MDWIDFSLSDWHHASSEPICSCDSIFLGTRTRTTTGYQNPAEKLPPGSYQSNITNIGKSRSDTREFGKRGRKSCCSRKLKCTDTKSIGSENCNCTILHHTKTAQKTVFCSISGGNRSNPIWTTPTATTTIDQPVRCARKVLIEEGKFYPSWAHTAAAVRPTVVYSVLPVKRSFSASGAKRRKPFEKWISMSTTLTDLQQLDRSPSLAASGRTQSDNDHHHHRSEKLMPNRRSFFPGSKVSSVVSRVGLGWVVSSSFFCALKIYSRCETGTLFGCDFSGSVVVRSVSFAKKIKFCALCRGKSKGQPEKYQKAPDLHRLSVRVFVSTAAAEAGHHHQFRVTAG